MQRLNLLSASLFASAFALQAAAQSPTLKTAPPPYLIPSPPQTSTITPYGTTQPFPFTTIVPLSHVNLTVAALNKPACYSMRSYGFTAKDLQSPNPHSSSFTECSPASTVSRKEIQGVLPAQSVITIQAVPNR